MSATQYSPRDQQTYGATTPAASFLDARSRFAHLFLDITPPGPFRGAFGETLHLPCQSQTDHSLAKYTFYISFDSKSKAKASLTKSGFSAPYYQFDLAFDVPDLGPNPLVAMTLVLEMHDENGLYMDNKAIGDFYYSQSYAALAESRSGKRKHAEEEGPASSPEAKRSSNQPLHILHYRDSSVPHPAHQTPLITPSPYASIPYGLPNRAMKQSSYGHTYPQGSYPFGDSSTSASASRQIRAPHNMASYGSSYPPMTHHQTPSPPMHSTRIGSHALSRTVSASAAPIWHRAPTSQQTTAASNRMNAGSHSQNFNPYGLYNGERAKLQIRGDLDSMRLNWTREEKIVNRRLVEFTRACEANVITASFKAVTPEDRNPSLPCISCIYWPSKAEWFVTSVDTIALLEGLVAVKFTVEEKNRIRRNLEGFKPYTVSKAKDECEDVFKLIMGFPNPKPRNIEKDIKIFPWKILGDALKKIIAKYVSTSSCCPLSQFRAIEQLLMNPAPTVCEL